MNSLYIVGAGGFGREVLGWALHVQQQTNSDWSVAGFLDQNAQALEHFDLSYTVLGDPTQYSPKPTDRFVCAIGNPEIKLNLCGMLQERGALFINLIHPSAVLGLQCRMGVGCILCPNTVLTTHVFLGNHVTLNVGTTVGHDVIIGDGCTLNSHCDVTGGAVLAKGVFLGSHASILPRAYVGEFARVGAGSVVLQKVSAYTSVLGVPAKTIPRP